MSEENRKTLVEQYVEEYAKKMRLMANGLAKMLQDGRALYDDELAEYIKLLASDTTMYSMYREELDKLVEEKYAQQLKP